MSSQVVDIKILERSYRVSCPDGQESELREAARQLNERMEETRTATKLTNIEQIAVMAALNLCHDWLQTKDEDGEKIAALEDKVRLLQATIEQAIGGSDDEQQPAAQKQPEPDEFTQQNFEKDQDIADFNSDQPDTPSRN